MSLPFTAHVRVLLKDGVLDPQGEAVRGGLAALGFAGVDDVRVGKWITVRLRAADAGEARRLVTAMCERLLANPVLERYEFDLEPAPAAAGAGGRS